MALTPFRKIRTQDKDLVSLQNALARIFLDLLGLEILNGRLIEDVVVTTSTVTVDHGLNRVLKGWIVVKKNADRRVWQTSITSTQLVLDSSATVTVSLWVF